MLSTTQCVVVTFTVLILNRIFCYRRKSQSVAQFSQVTTLFEPVGLPGLLFRTSQWHIGFNFHWVLRKSFYRDHGSESVAIVPLLIGNPVIYTSNLDVARQVICGEHRLDYEKPHFPNRLLSFWGTNVVGSNGETWKRHRRIVGRAFNKKLYESVWETSAMIYYDMVRLEGWADCKTVNIPVMQTVILQVGLMVIGRCGFGFPFEWRATSVGFHSDTKMSMNEAFQLVINHSLFVTLMPKWFKNLHLKRFEPIMKGIDILARFMQDSIEKGRNCSENNEDKLNAFDMIMKANMIKSGKLTLDDSEVIGNVWALLFAGHETTARTLAATLGLLSIHNEIQTAVYNQIKDVLSDHDEPVINDYSRLDKVLCVFYEAIRMFPAAHMMIRDTTKDTILQIANPISQDHSKNVHIPKGMRVIIDMIGLQYNPRYFFDPYTYKPFRWEGGLNIDDFTAFSFGPRACLGQKFATTEAISFLTLILRDWEVRPSLNHNETQDQWCKRVFEGELFVTLGVQDVPLTFVRRD